MREQVFAHLALGLRPSGNLQYLMSLFFTKFQDGRAPSGGSVLSSPCSVSNTSQVGLRKERSSHFPEGFV